MTNKEVVLLATHFVDDSVINKYRRLNSELDKKKYVVILLVNTEEGKLFEFPNDIICYFTDSNSLNELGYNPIEETLLPGSCHFPVLRFFIDNPMYMFYWFIEYDVEFTGNWSVLMNECSIKLHNYDFLSCHIERYNIDKNRDWPWWYMGNNLHTELNKCIKGFNPICRYSNEALGYIDACQKKGCSAHSEVLITTCLYHGGYKIGDFGGDGDFVPNGFTQKFYIPNKNVVNDGTMRYRPVYTSEEIKRSNLQNILFHPLKE